MRRVQFTLVSKKGERPAALSWRVPRPHPLPGVACGQPQRSRTAGAGFQAEASAAPRASQGHREREGRLWACGGGLVPTASLAGNAGQEKVREKPASEASASGRLPELAPAPNRAGQGRRPKGGDRQGLGAGRDKHATDGARPGEGRGPEKVLPGPRPARTGLGRRAGAAALRAADLPSSSSPQSLAMVSLGL